MIQSTNQTFGVQQQNNNRQLQGPQNTGNLQGPQNAGNLQGPQNTGNLQGLQNTSNFQGALNSGRQAPGPQTIPNLFIDAYTPVQQYNDLVEGSSPFDRAQGVEISPQNTQLSRDLFSGFSFT
ncbi:27691_t:CDS:1 [Gigaspora margarita]|uniref:27691_t:CDS:1 n=1 Tax=Gigaspora margarita TaxID=4874 RepID=A0ABN7V181_GIGMA|nr:27691_t:CDS:1 [Gigaspora margarita]